MLPSLHDHDLGSLGYVLVWSSSVESEALSDSLSLGDPCLRGTGRICRLDSTCHHRHCYFCQQAGRAIEDSLVSITGLGNCIEHSPFLEPCD